MVDVIQDKAMEIFNTAKHGIQEGNGAISQQKLDGKDILSILGSYEYRLRHIHKWWLADEQSHCL